GDGVCSAEWPKLAGGAAEGQYCTQAGVPPENMANAKDFVTRFPGKYGPIQVYAPYSYDAAMTLIAAMQKANSTDPAKYLPELANISYDGVTAKIEFDEHGDTKNGAITLYQVKDGRLVPAAANVGGKTEKVGAEVPPTAHWNVWAANVGDSFTPITPLEVRVERDQEPYILVADLSYFA